MIAGIVKIASGITLKSFKGTLVYANSLLVNRKNLLKM